MSEEMQPKRGSAKSTFSSTGTVARLVFAWLWVGIPLATGVALTVKSSIPLFHENPPAVSPTTAK